MTRRNRATAMVLIDSTVGTLAGIFDFVANSHVVVAEVVVDADRDRAESLRRLTRSEGAGGKVEATRGRS